MPSHKPNKGTGLRNLSPAPVPVLGDVCDDQADNRVGGTTEGGAEGACGGEGLAVGFRESCWQVDQEAPDGDTH